MAEQIPDSQSPQEQQFQAADSGQTPPAGQAETPQETEASAEGPVPAGATPEPGGQDVPAMEAPPQGERAAAPAEAEAAAAPAEQGAAGEAATEGGGPEGAVAAEKATEELPEYGVAAEDAGTLKKKVTVTVPAARIEAKRQEMFGELDKTAQVPGFRIGHAPRRLIEKRFGREVGRDVRNALVGESLGKVVEKTKLQTVGEPELDLEAIELPESGDLTYSFVVEVAPDFELPNLEGIEVVRPVMEVTEERIDASIDRMRMSLAKYEVTDEPAGPQDQVRVAAKISGEGIEERTVAATLRVAPGQVEGLPLLDLGEKLAGRKVGETAALTVKVPEVHPNEAWRGKEARLELTLEEVRRRVLPAIDAEFAQRRGYDSVAELRDDLRLRMGAEIDRETRRVMREQVRGYLLAHATFDLPPEAAKRNAARVLARRYVDLLQQGLPEEQIQEHLTQVQARVFEEANRDLKLTFMLQRIAEERQIEVTAEEVNSAVAQMARARGRRPERLRQDLEDQKALEQVAVAIQEDKVIGALLRDAKIVARTEAEMAAEAEAAEAGETAEGAEGVEAGQPEAGETAGAARGAGGGEEPAPQGGEAPPQAAEPPAAPEEGGKAAEGGR